MLFGNEDLQGFGNLAGREAYSFLTSDFLQGFFSNLVGILKVLFGNEDLQGFGNLSGRET